MPASFIHGSCSFLFADGSLCPQWAGTFCENDFLETYSAQWNHKRRGRSRAGKEATMETKEFISRQEAAALAGVTSATITKWVQLERFPCVGVGRVLRIYRNEFLQWLKEYKEGGV